MHRDHRGRRGHKDLRICRQVYDVLTFALAELDDPMIDELVLAHVTPAPNAARVQVTLVPSRDGIDVDSSAVLARLDEYAADLREEVAAEVSRRRVPELVFRIAASFDTLG